MLTVKRGDTFDQLVSLPDTFADGYFVDWTITSQIRTSQYSRLVAEFSPTWLDPVTTRVVKLFMLDTQSWPIGTLQLDIQFTRNSDSYVISTQTLDVTVTKDITFPTPVVSV